MKRARYIVLDHLRQLRAQTAASHRKARLVALVVVTLLELSLIISFISFAVSPK